MEIPPPCPCGKSWDILSNFSNTIRELIEDIVQEHGLLVPMKVYSGLKSRTFMVSRRCIAFHGITGPQLLSGNSGFEEIPNGRDN